MKKYESIELVKVCPDVLSRVKFDKTVGNKQDGFVKFKKDSDSNKRKLIVTAPVTHAARLTSNNGLYQARRMVTDIKSFLEPYNKPILVEHDTEKDPIGRVVDAMYEPISHKFLDGSPEKYNFKNTFDLFKWLMKEGLLYEDSFPGVGQAVLSMEVTDQKAIEKFLDKRFLTFSVRVASNEIYDPLTGLPFRRMFTDEDDEEEKYSPYRPGEIVDGMPLPVVLDELKYKEVSTSTIPADETAIVRDIMFTDSKDCDIRAEPMKVDGSYQIKLISKKENIQIGDVKNMENETKQELPKEVQDSNSDDNKTQEKVIEVENNEQFVHIVDSSTSDEIYQAMEIILDEMVDSGEIEKNTKLTKEERQDLKGSQFCGPNRSFPAFDSAHIEASKRLLEKADMSESQKQRILACVNRKAKQMNCDGEKEELVSMSSFLDNLSNLSDFDFVTVLDSVLNDCLDREIAAEDSEALATLLSKVNTKTANTISESKIAELESEKNTLEEQVDCLTNDVKTYTALSNVFMKIFKDNLKISSIEDAILFEKNEKLDSLKEEAEKLLKDDKLIKKVSEYLGGFTKDEDHSDSENQIEDPTLSSARAKTDISDNFLEKQIFTRFQSMKIDKGLGAALSYLDKMSASQYVSKKFVEEIKNLNSETTDN
tara:strand:- start:904 stop:2862 length:1959 start_codon:yes stop_codon:yes gene_type:complete